MIETTPEKPRMADELVACPYCQCSVNARRLKLHTSKRCPKAPLAIEAKLRESSPKLVSTPVISSKKKILVRSRLERLFKELNQNSADPDDGELAKVFKAFYIMYVWQGDAKNFSAPRSVEVDANGEFSTSIRAVSGGLPSLGKRAK